MSKITAIRHHQMCRNGTAFFVLCVFAVAWLCLMLVNDLRVEDTEQSVGGFRLVAISLANALLLLLPYWLLPRRWRWLVWLPITVLSLWCLVQVCYFRAYDDMMPWRSMTITGNVNSTLMASTVALLRWHDLVYVLPLLVLAAVYLMARPAATATPGRVKPFLLTLMVMLVIAFVGYYVPGENRARRYLVNFSNRNYYSDNGLIPYSVFTLYNTIFVTHTVTDADRDKVKRFLEQECPHYDDNRFSDGQRRNLVLIIVESLHTWPIGMRVQGREVTPVLNSLVSGDSVIYAPHMLFQTSHGHSSDAHFIYNTGLLPLRDGVVAVEWGDGPYPALSAALQGYDCREIICTPGINWNQTVTARTYGFERLYTRDDLTDSGCLQRHGDIDDAALTDFASSLLPELSQPFFLEMVTMTMHAPYTGTGLPPSWITASDTLNAEARGYLNCVNLTDSCIGAFLDDLKRAGLDNRTVVAIVSDHTQIYLNRIKGLTDYQSVPDDWGIPLIISGCDTTLRHDPIVGQVDVFPTLLDVMGANAYRWKGLGHSLLRYNVTSAVQPRNMSILGDSNVVTSHQREAWEVSRLLILDRSLLP